MKLSRAKSRIIGLQAGEVTINMLGGKAILRAKFALVTGDGDTAGYLDKAAPWSEKTEELLRHLTESMEDDVLPLMFEVAEEGESPDKVDEEPPQI